MAEIGVDHADDFGIAGGEAFDDGRAEAQLSRAMNDPHRKARRQIIGNLPRAVRRVVVHDDERRR